MKLNFRNSTEKMAVVGICTALIIVLSQLAIPMPSGVPITLQTFAIALCGFILGAKLSAVATLIYVVIGAIGLPVFASFSGGIAILVGYTGGFIWGFIAMAFICGLGAQAQNKIIAIASGLLGLLVCHVCGAFQYGMIAGIDFISSFLLVCAPYLIKDIVTVVLAYGISQILLTALLKSRLIKA